MATDTETLSLPTTTAPTEVAASTCLPHDENHFRGIKREWCTDEWDTSITANFQFPPKLGGPSNSAHQTTTTTTQQPQQQQDQESDAAMTGKYVAQTNPDDCDRPLKRRPSSDCWLTSNLLSTYRSVEESCKRALEHFPCPSISFAMPTLEFDFRIAVALNPEPSRIENRVQKEITTIKGGRWSGSFGNGRVMV